MLLDYRYLATQQAWQREGLRAEGLPYLSVSFSVSFRENLWCRCRHVSWPANVGPRTDSFHQSGWHGASSLS